jgi:fatty-acyl-CoA synthase
LVTSPRRATSWCAARLDAGLSRETFAVAVESAAWQDKAEVRRIEHQVAHEVALVS